jgi:hypothetical protein
VNANLDDDGRHGRADGSGLGGSLLATNSFDGGVLVLDLDGTELSVLV